MIGESIRFVVRRALVPSLRDDGYNKHRHHWWRAEEDLVRCVTARSSTGNQGCQGTFRIDVGIRTADEPWIRSSPSTSPRVADCPRHWTLSALGGDIAVPDVYGIDGNTDLFALAEVVRWQWEAVGLPFLRAAGDPVWLDAWSSDRA